MHGIISTLSVLFHGSVCQYHVVLITFTLLCSLISDSMIPPNFFFFFEIAVATLGLLCFHINFRIMCSSSEKYTIGIFIGIALNLQIDLGSIGILIVLLIHGHYLCFHLFVFSSICLQIFWGLGEDFPFSFIVYAVTVDTIFSPFPHICLAPLSCSLSQGLEGPLQILEDRRKCMVPWGCLTYLYSQVGEPCTLQAACLSACLCKCLHVTRPLV